MKTLIDFVKKSGLSLKLTPIDHRPDRGPQSKEEKDWDATANHYKFTFYRPIGKYVHQYSGHFSTGSGWTKDPEMDDILDSLASDSMNIENTGFEEWASEHGYDTDSRMAFHLYGQCERQISRLKNFLGDQLFEELVYQTERL